MKQYELVVIGSGIASVPARKCAKEGWKVALVDELPPGGTCALRGCTPKKLLRSGAEVIDLIRRMEGRCVNLENMQTSWPDIMAHKNSYTDPIPGNNKKNYADQGIDFYEASARFVSPSELTLSSAEETINIQTKKTVIATGARPADLPFPGSELLVSSDDFLNLPSLPKRIAFAGGGFISMEYAHIAARFGAETHVLQRRALPLKTFDPDLVAQLVKVGEEHAGVHFHSFSQIDAVEKNENVYLVHFTNVQTDEKQVLEVDMVIHGAGRVPNLEGLDLENANVDFDRKGVTVNEYLQSVSNPDVYAAGDCSGSGAPQLSFTASKEGLAVSENLLNGNQIAVDYTGQASVAFTIPAIGRAGMTEEEVREAGIEIDVRFAETPRWFTNRRLNEGAGGYKIIIDKKSDRVIGAHFLAHHCEEFINIFALAIYHRMTRTDLKKVLWSHPSSASDLSRMLG